LRAPRLYVVVRDDLAPGLRAAQAIHAAVTWTLEHGEPPPDLVVLETNDIDDVESFALWEKLQAASFHEPDLDDQLTAVAFALHEGTWERSFDSACRRYLREMPLALSQGR
jgi:hypothetical protein